MNKFSFCRDNYGYSSRWGSDEESITKAEDVMWQLICVFLLVMSKMLL